LSINRKYTAKNFKHSDTVDIGWFESLVLLQRLASWFFFTLLFCKFWLYNILLQMILESIQQISAIQYIWHGDG